MQTTSLATAGRSNLDSILRILTVAFALALVGFTTPLVLADHMGNHERPLVTSECADKSDESESQIADDSETSDDDSSGQSSGRPS